LFKQALLWVFGMNRKILGHDLCQSVFEKANFSLEAV
jgi:hypothetical protein